MTALFANEDDIIHCKMGSIFSRIKAFFSGNGNRSQGVDIAPGEVKKGTVTYFNWSKGYGFIECPGVEGRIFLHRSKLNGRLKVGDVVQFELAQNKRGLFAKRLLTA